MGYMKMIGFVFDGYASITAFKDYFNISDEQFFDLCQQYGLTEIYKELL